MRVDSLRVRNFRCFGIDGDNGWGLVFRPSQGLNLIVGPNGSGKTAILDALDIALNPEGRGNTALISVYDFYNCNTLGGLCIEVTLTRIDDVIPDFEADIQWIDPSDGRLIEDKGIDLDSAKHQRALVIRFEAGLDEHTGAIEWAWRLPKFPATSIEDPKELKRSQHDLLGYYRIRPAVSAGAFTLGRFSALGRYLRKLEYRLAKLPTVLSGESTPPNCMLLDPNCEDCPDRSDCLPATADGEEPRGYQLTLGALLAEVVARARSLIGTDTWSEMTPSVGPRYGGVSSALAGLTIGIRPNTSESDQFIPFERLSAGEKYALSFALARSRIPGDVAPLIVMEEPETALYPSGIASLIREIQATPSRDAPQVFLASHSEAVLRCALPEDVFVASREYGIKNLGTILRSASSASQDALSRAEHLLMPGGPTVLLADKVLVVEGAQDAIVSGYLDRLAAKNAAKGHSPHVSFASKSWCIYPAGNADTIVDDVPILQSLGKKVAALFDADGSGKANAEKTKALCPTFTYRSAAQNQPCVEEALLLGLTTSEQGKVISKYHSFAYCKSCDRVNANCWATRGSYDCGSMDERKRRLQLLCLEHYEATGGFPKAFDELLIRIDTVGVGLVHELDIEA